MACLDALLQNMTVLEFGPEAARLFARIAALLQQQGKPAGDMDVLIPATARAAAPVSPGVVKAVASRREDGVPFFCGAAMGRWSVSPASMQRSG